MEHATLGPAGMSVSVRSRWHVLLRSSALPVVLAVLFVATPTPASQSYPMTMEQALDMSCPPDCTLCHTRPSGGTLTANTPVGISARRAGLECCDTSGLLDVIAALETNRTDSDADGVPDTEELRAGTNPNALEGNMKCLPPESDHGCAIAGLARGRASLWAVGAALALGLLTRARRRRGRHFQ